MKVLISLVTVLVSVSAFAANGNAKNKAQVAEAGVHACGNLVDIGGLIEQKGIVVKGFDGDVKVAYVSTEEPAAVPDHVLVYIYGEAGSYECFAVSADSNGNGFSGVDFDHLTSKAINKTTLSVAFPVMKYDGSKSVPAGMVTLKVTADADKDLKKVEIVK